MYFFDQRVLVTLWHKDLEAFMQLWKDETLYLSDRVNAYFYVCFNSKDKDWARWEEILIDTFHILPCASLFPTLEALIETVRQSDVESMAQSKPVARYPAEWFRYDSIMLERKRGVIAGPVMAATASTEATQPHDILWSQSPTIKRKQMSKDGEDEIVAHRTFTERNESLSPSASKSSSGSTVPFEWAFDTDEEEVNHIPAIRSQSVPLPEPKEEHSEFSARYYVNHSKIYYQDRVMQGIPPSPGGFLGRK